MHWLATHSYLAAWASATIALFVQAEPHFSWIQGFVIPVLFTIIGAALGFFASQLRDDRSARRAKQDFLHAVGMELDALSTQLDASLAEVTGSIERLERGAQTGPHFAATLRTAVFTTQLGKLRDVADPQVIELIHFYCDLGRLDQIFEGANLFSGEYNHADVPSGAKDVARDRLRSNLFALKLDLTGFGNRVKQLRKKLLPLKVPGADSSGH